MEMTEIEAPTEEVAADRDVAETMIDDLSRTADFSTGAEGGMETRVLDSGGVEVSRIGADIRVPGPTDSLYLKYLDLGGLKYETADMRQRPLIGSIASWVAHVRSAYNYRPTGKTVINLHDFLLDSGGLKLKVVVKGQVKAFKIGYRAPRVGYLALKGLAETNIPLRRKLESIFPDFDFNATLDTKGSEIMRMSRPIDAVDIGPTPQGISNQELRIAAARAGGAAREVASLASADAGTDTIISGEDIERLRELERGLNGGQADLIARIQELEKVDRSIAETVESLTEDQRKLERLEPTESEFVETQDRIERHEERLRSLREQREAHIAAIASIRGNLRSQITRIRDTIDKVLNIDRGIWEKLQTIFIEQGVTIISLAAAVSAILAAIITALTSAVGSVTQAATGGGATPDKPDRPGNPAEPDTPDQPPDAPSEPAGVKEYLKRALRWFSQLMKKLSTKALAALPGILGSIVSYLLTLLGGAASWLAQNLLIFVLALIAIVAAELRSRRVF
jgi:hypothetical protein